MSTANKQAESIVERDLNEAFPPDWLRAQARRTGLIKRERKIDAVVLFWVFVFKFGANLQGRLAGLKRAYEKQRGTTLSDGSWYKRFTPELVAFLHACLMRGFETLASECHRNLAKDLGFVKDVLIQDSTIVRVHKALATKWPAARARTVAAGLKINLVVSAVADGPKRVLVAGERESEAKLLRIGRWVKDRILLIDMGYYKHQAFARIQENGGYFITRLKDNANPTFTQLVRTVRGNSIDVEGKTVKQVLPNLRRQTLDAMVELTFRRRGYRGTRSGDALEARLVAVRNAETGTYHTYVTNIPPDVLDAEDVAALYAARWHVELIFKELKDRYDLDVLPTRNPRIVEAYIWIALLALVVSRRIYHLVRSRNPTMRLRYTSLRWSKIFTENSGEQMVAVLAYAGIEFTTMQLVMVYDSQALDPHVNRPRLWDRWEG